jgi:hypothetical protein
MAELQHAAAQQLLTGRSPRGYRFFVRGHEITNPKGFENFVGHGDTVVVKPNFVTPPCGPLMAKGPQEPLNSTQKADYVGTAAPPAVPIIKGKGASVLDKQSKDKLYETQSQSHADFVHYQSPRMKPNRANMLCSIKAFDAEHRYLSSYKSQFTRPLQPTAREALTITNDPRKSVISSNTLGKCFDAQSNYNEHFVRLGGSPAQPVIGDSTSTLTEAVMAQRFQRHRS